MVRLWSVHGPFMVRSRSVHGPFTVRSRSVYGSFMVRLWFVYGSFMVRSRSVHGPFTVRSWSVHGPFMVRSWSVRGPFMVRHRCEIRRGLHLRVLGLIFLFFRSSDFPVFRGFFGAGRSWGKEASRSMGACDKQEEIWVPGSAPKGVNKFRSFCFSLVLGGSFTVYVRAVDAILQARYRDATQKAGKKHNIPPAIILLRGLQRLVTNEL
jgi:hypothetical protein